MADGQADRLGVDLSVEGFSSFETNMARVNELLADFAKKVKPFASSASSLDLALKALSQAGGLAAGGFAAFGLALSSFAKGGSRILSGLPAKLNAAAAALANFHQASSGAAGGLTNITIPKVTGGGTAKTSSIPSLSKETQAQIKLMADLKKNAAASDAAEANRKVALAAETAKRIAAIEQKQLSDSIAAEKIREEARNQRNKVSDDQKAEIQSIKAAQQERVNAISDSLKRTASLQQDARLRSLAESKLGAINEKNAKRQIEDEFLAEINTINRRANNVAFEFSEQKLREFRRTADEIRAISGKVIADIQSKSQIKGPSLAGQGRARLRDDLSRQNLQTFEAGKSAERAKSANVLVRTAQQAIDRASDSAAIFGFRIQQIQRSLGGLGQIILLPFRIVLAPIFLVINAIQALLSGFEKLKSVSSAIASPFKAIGNIFSGFGGKKKTAGPDISMEAKKAASANGQISQSVDNSNRSIQILSGNTVKLGNIFSNLFRSQKQVSQSFDLSSRNINSFNSEVNKVSNSTRIFRAILAPVTSIGNVVKGATTSVKNFSAGFSATVGPVSAFNTAIHNANTNVTQMGTNASRTASVLNTALGVTIGNLSAKLAEFAVSSAKAFAGEGLNALASFESQLLGIQTLARREILDTSGTISFADAEVLAAEKGNDLFDQLQQLAIVSPFETEDITRAFSLAESYDFTSDEALKLVKILADFASGTGKDAQAIEQITVALGQVQAAGRLTGEEFRQLRANGVPVLRALSDATGKTTKEINEFIRKGGTIAADTAIGAIAKTLGTEFVGAAEKSQGTIRGLISSFNDLRKISLKNIFQPIAEQLLKPFVGNLVDQLNTGEFQKRTKAIGEAITTAMIVPINLIGTAIGTIKALVAEIPAPVKAVAFAFAELGSAIFAAAGLFRILQPILAVVIPLLLSVLSPISLIGIGLAALQVTWTQNWFGIQQVAASVVTGVIDTVSRLADALSPEKLLGKLSEAPPFVLEIAQSISDTFSSLLTNVVNFGAGIVQSLAEGIVGAVSVVIDALNYIGSAIASLLETHSPPKLLPDLDTWGTAAADVWLEGWTKADFSIFNDLSDSIQKALSSIDPNIDTGEIKKIQTAVADLVASFVATGSVDSSILSTLGDFDASTIAVIESLATATLEAAAATEKYEAIQKELSDTTEQFDEALKPIEARLKSLSEQEQALNDADQTKSLTNVLNNRFATEEQKRRAAIKLQEIQAEKEKTSLEDQKDAALSAIEERLKAAEKEKSIAEDELAILQERFNIQFQFTAEAQKAADAAGNAGDEADKAAKKAKKLKKVLGELEAPGLASLADLQLPDLDIEKKIAPALDNFQKKINEAQASVSSSFTTLRTNIESEISLISDAFNTGFSGIEDPQATGIGLFANRLGVVAGNLTAIAEQIKDKFLELRKIFNQGFSGGALSESGGKGNEEIIPAASLEGLALRAGKAAESLSGAFDSIVARAQKFSTDFSAAFAAAGAAGETSVLKKFFIALDATNIDDDVTRLRDKIVTGINMMFGSTQTVTIDFSAIKTSITTGLNNLFGAVGKGGVAIGESVGEFASFAGKIYNQISSALGLGTIDTDALKTNIKTSITNLFSGAATGGQELVATVSAKLDLLFGTVTFSSLATSFENLKIEVGNAIEGLVWGADITVDTLSGLAKTAGEKILKIEWSKYIVTDIFGGLSSAVSSVIKSIFDAFSSGDPLGSLGKGTEGAIGGIGQAISGITGLATDLSNQADIPSISAGLAASVVTVLGTALANIPKLVSDTLSGLTKSGQTGDQKSIATTFGETLGSVLVGIIGGAFTILKPENLLNLIKGTGDLIGTIAVILGQVIVGVFSGVSDRIAKFSEENSAKLADLDVSIQTFFINLLNAPIVAVNSAFDLINEGLKKIGQKPIEPIDVFAIKLTPENFKVLTPDQIEIPDILNLSAPEIIDPSTVFEINGERVILADPGAIFALDPNAKELVQPGSLIEINGEQKLRVLAKDIIETDESTKITIAPGEVIELDKTKPIKLNVDIDLETQVTDAALASVVTGAGSGATSKASDSIRDALQKDLDAKPLNLPPINTGDPSLDVAGKAAGLNFAASFGNIDSATQKRLIEKILTLPTDQAAVLHDAGLGIANGVVNGITVTADQITAAQEAGRLLGIGLKDGVVSGATLSNADISTAAGVIQSITDAMVTEARIKSPSGLTHDEVGLDMGAGILAGIKETLGNIGDILGPLIEALSSSGLQAAATTSTEKITGVFQKMAADIGTLLLSVVTNTRSALSSVDTIFDPLVTALSSGTIQTAALTSATKIKTIFKTMSTEIGTIFLGVKTDIASTFTQISQDALTQSTDMTTQIAEVYQTFVDDNLDRFTGFFEDLSDLFDGGYSTITKITNNFIDDTNNSFDDFAQNTRETFKDLIDKIVSEFKRLKKNVTDLVDETATNVESAFKKIRDKMEDLAKEGVQAASDQFALLDDALAKALDAAIAVLSDATRLTSVRTAGKNIGDTLIDGIVSALTGSSGNDAVDRIANAILSIINRASNQVASGLGGNTQPPNGQPQSRSSSDFGTVDVSASLDSSEINSTLGKILDRLTSTDGSSIAELSAKTLALLTTTNNSLLPLRSTPLAQSGFSLSTVSTGAPIVIQSGDTTTVNQLNINGVTERQANRLASSFDMFKRLNARASA